MTKAVHEIKGLKWVRIGDHEYAAEIGKRMFLKTVRDGKRIEHTDPTGVVITHDKGGICWLPGVFMKDIMCTIEEDTE